jgi:hypothetical protein
MWMHVLSITFVFMPSWHCLLPVKCVVVVQVNNEWDVMSSVTKGMLTRMIMLLGACE